MRYQLLNSSQDESLIQRLLNVRKIEEKVEQFLNPSLNEYRLDPYLLEGMETAVSRIQQAILREERIMIFGDYDVDGVTSSYMLYTFFKQFLGYDKVSIMFPHRLEDGYGIKTYHLDQIKEKGVGLVITVDNGITAIAEAKHAREIGLDLIITDHHKNLPEIPDALAVINPQISPRYPFKGICGAGVAFKLLRAMTKTILPADHHRQIFRYFLPIVAVATVSDCVPLVHENRVFVKLGLEMLNSKEGVPESLLNFIDYLNIKTPVETFHIGFMIGPRLNAGGRILTPYESLYTLLYSGEKQLRYLKQIDEINTERKKLQDLAAKEAESGLDHSKHVLIASSEAFHEGVVGIVAGRLSEKYHKPSVVLAIKPEQGTAVGSLRGPDYFNVIDMLYDARDLLERFGGHKQAGGLTVSLDKLPALMTHLENYCAQHVDPSNLEKTLYVDTEIFAHEFQHDQLSDLQSLAPFGVGNEEPLFLLQSLGIQKVQKVGSRGAGHLKFQARFQDRNIECLFRGKGDQIDSYSPGQDLHCVGRIKKDTFKSGYYVDGVMTEIPG